MMCRNINWGSHLLKLVNPRFLLSYCITLSLPQNPMYWYFGLLIHYQENDNNNTVLFVLLISRPNQSGLSNSIRKTPSHNLPKDVLSLSIVLLVILDLVNPWFFTILTLTRILTWPHFTFCFLCSLRAAASASFINVFVILSLLK
jgi:hypothetical protein